MPSPRTIAIGLLALHGCHAQDSPDDRPSTTDEQHTPPATSIPVVTATTAPAAEPVVPDSEDPVFTPPTRTTQVPADVVINELCAANQSLAQDETYAFGDWVELLNTTQDTVLLEGWGLSDDADAPAWDLPALELEPGGHVLLWLDGWVERGATHAPFGLDRDGDTLTLWRPDGTVADSWTFEDQAWDVVLARLPDGGAHIAPTILATPWSRNPVDPGISLDPSDALFPYDEVLHIELFLDEEAYDTLAASGTNRVPAGLGWEGVWLPEVELTLKGGIGSFRELSGKAGFRINLDALTPGQRLRGLENITLNSMVQDRSGVHERLVYMLMRQAGVPAPRTSYARVTLNGEYRGLYLMLEPPDDQFLKRWYDDPDGNLYEGAYGVDLTAGGLWGFEHDEQGADDVTDRSDLMRLVELLDTPAGEDRVAELEALVDVDLTLLAMASEVITGDWDGYFYARNNYRLYHEPSTDQFSLLPWGMDQTLSWWGNTHSATGRLADWMLDIPSISTRYDLALWTMTDRLQRMPAAEEAWFAHDLILPWYDLDPYKEGTTGQMTSGVDDAISYCEDRPVAVLDELFPDGPP
jgi:hypothetical protein